MSDIYMMADEVCIWLGQESSKSPLAMEIMIKYMDAISVFPDGGSGVAESGFDAYGACMQNVLENQKSELDALMELFRRPYWMRLWVRQEIYHASYFSILCGMDHYRCDAAQLRKQRWCFDELLDLLKEHVEQERKNGNPMYTSWEESNPNHPRYSDEELILDCVKNLFT